MPRLINDLATRKSLTGSQIKGADASAILEPFQAKDVCVDEVANVNVIANAGLIWRVVVGAKDCQCVSGWWNSPTSASGSAPATLKYLNIREVIPKQWRNFLDQVTDNFRIISHRNVRVLE